MPYSSTSWRLCDLVTRKHASLKYPADQEYSRPKILTVDQVENRFSVRFVWWNIFPPIIFPTLTMFSITSPLFISMRHGPGSDGHAAAGDGRSVDSVDHHTGRPANEGAAEVGIAACPDPTRVSYGQVRSHACYGSWSGGRGGGRCTR